MLGCRAVTYQYRALLDQKLYSILFLWEQLKVECVLIQKMIISSIGDSDSFRVLLGINDTLIVSVALGWPTINVKVNSTGMLLGSTTLSQG